MADGEATTVDADGGAAAGDAIPVVATLVVATPSRVLEVQPDPLHRIRNTPGG